MKLTWIGHSCFKIEKDGYTILTDPYGDDSVPGYAPVRETADMVLISHEHADHNARDLITLTQGKENPFTITYIDTYHDEVQGAKRGPSRIYILDDGENRIAHLGDLGCELTPEQAEQLKGLDAVLIPVGGFFTIDASQAAALIKELNPRIAIPMHYRDDQLGFGYETTQTVDVFLSKVPDARVLSVSTIETTEEQPAQVLVLRPLLAG